jgi:hypothetical protein
VLPADGNIMGDWKAGEKVARTDEAGSAPIRQAR